MGPDEEKNYTDPVIMHLNPETGEWEEVGKLKNIKEIKVDDKDLDEGDIRWFKTGSKFKGTFKTNTPNTEYMVLPVKLRYDVRESAFTYIPVQNNNVFYANDYNTAINGMIKRFGTVVKIIEPDRRLILIINASMDVYGTIAKLYERNCDAGYLWAMPKVIDIFEPINIDCKNYLLYLLIKVR